MFGSNLQLRALSEVSASENADTYCILLRGVLDETGDEMRRCNVDRLAANQIYWIPVVVSPERDWAGAPGCRRGGRYIVNRETLRASRDEFETFDSKLTCLNWIMENRAQLSRALPGATIRVVRLDRWLLGMD